MNIVNKLWRAFWRAVALFAWRRWAEPGWQLPDGVPGNRDPAAPCTAYAPTSEPFGWRGCQGDGHYLCSGCGHHVARNP